MPRGSSWLCAEGSSLIVCGVPYRMLEMEPESADTLTAVLLLCSALSSHKRAGLGWASCEWGALSCLISLVPREDRDGGKHPAVLMCSFWLNA